MNNGPNETSPSSQLLRRLNVIQEKRLAAERTALARRVEAAEMVAHRAEEFLDQLDKRWPEVTDLDEWRDALLEAISELRTL